MNREIIEAKLRRILEEKLDMLKDIIQLDEAPRVKIVKARVRGGKIQRRKKVSNVAGYTLRGGKMKRMSAKERLNRKISQRRGKLKRKAKLARALMKRKRSLRKRSTLGV
jgi:hypothetical protein